MARSCASPCASDIFCFSAPRVSHVPYIDQAYSIPLRNQRLWTKAQTVRPPSTLSWSRYAIAARHSLDFNFPSTAPGKCMLPFREDGRFLKWPLLASQDDFEVEGIVEFEDDEKEDEEENELQDYETDYDVAGKFGDQDRLQDGDAVLSSRGEAAETVVDYKINENEFHKLSLQNCDFFIRKVPDVDDDVFDFSEMYVTDSDTDVYAIPRIAERLPKRPIRLTVQKHEHFCTHELPVEGLRSPMVKNELQVMKIFLMKHYKNRRASSPDFVIDFDQIYVIDSKMKSISRAKVTLNVLGGADRDRRKEVLIVNDDGAIFTVIPESKKRTPDELVLERQWNRTKKDLDNYLKSFRDYPISNWF